jgi:GNAT superfamily N-acetyltransferase
MFDIVESHDDALLAEFYGRHWHAMGIDEAAVAPDWREAALAFIASARVQAGFAGFVARDAGRPIGAACCHLVARVFPAFRVGDAARIGYVWGVYVDPDHRSRGTGAALVRACVAHLDARGCDRALLHAGDRSRPLYARLGFVPTDEMALAISRDRPGG